MSWVDSSGQEIEIPASELDQFRRHLTNRIGDWSRVSVQESGGRVRLKLSVEGILAGTIARPSRFELDWEIMWRMALQDKSGSFRVHTFETFQELTRMVALRRELVAAAEGWTSTLNEKQVLPGGWNAFQSTLNWWDKKDDPSPFNALMQWEGFHGETGCCQGTLTLSLLGVAKYHGVGGLDAFCLSEGSDPANATSWLRDIESIYSVFFREEEASNPTDWIPGDRGHLQNTNPAITKPLLAGENLVFLGGNYNLGAAFVSDSRFFGILGVNSTRSLEAWAGSVSVWAKGDEFANLQPKRWVPKTVGGAKSAR